MKLKSTQRKSLATVPSDYQGQERRFAQSVSESLDILTGRRGDIIDRAVTFRDLLDTGVLTLKKSLGTGSTSGGVSVTNPNNSTDDGLPIQLPTQPQNFVASGGFDVIFLSWELPPYGGHSYVEIYRLQRVAGAAEPTLAQAEEAGVYTRYYGDVYRFTDTNVGSQENWYYWIRAVNKNEVAGAFYSSTGVNATTALDYLYISGLIDDILDDDVNTLGLNTAIEGLNTDITSLSDFTGYTSAYTGNSLITRLGAVETLASNAATSAQLLTEQTTRANADSALAADITTLNSTVYNGTSGVAATYSGLQTEISTRASADSALSTRTTALESTVNNGTSGVAATYSALLSEQTTRANADTALASDITTLTSTVSGHTTSIQTNTSTINGVQGKYSVKIDNNNHVSGFGLVSTANDATVTSAFIVASDRFAIAAPFNASTTDDAAVGTNYPFKVFTSATTVNGVSIPAGAYIDDAFIHNAQITNAMIKDATITSAKISDLTATKITSGNIQITATNDIKIYQGKTSFTSTSSGFWLGLNNNAGSFHVGANASKYLKFDGNSGDLITSGIEVRASDGTVLLDAGGLRSSEGGNLVYNGGFVHGLEGWTTSGGTVSFNTSLARAYTDAGENIQSQVKIPVSPEEPLYIYADFYGASGFGQLVFFTSDGNTYTSTTISGSLWSPNAAASQAFRVAKIDYPTGNTWAYAIAKFGTLSGGSATTWHQVGVSKTPPVIDPSYASTYIRDLSVDTLQIAGSAITVPDGTSQSISKSLTTSYQKMGELTVDYGSADTTPEGLIVVCGLQVSGDGSTDQGIQIEIRRVYSNNSYNGEHITQSVKSDFGHAITMGAHFLVSQVGTATSVTLELHARLGSEGGTRSANRFFITSIASKR